MHVSTVSRTSGVLLPRPLSHAHSRRVSPARNRLGWALVAATMAYVCCFGSSGADCIDYGDYLHWVGGVQTPGQPHAMVLSGNYVYVAALQTGLQVIDIADPQNPQIVGSVDTPRHAYNVAVSGT